MQWLDDVKTKFITRFTENIVCHFSDGDLYRNCSTGAIVTSQPTDTKWIRFTAINGATSNATIGQGSQRLKREPFNVIVSIFVPRSETFASTATLINALDTAMFFDDFISGEGGCIQLATDEPKFQDVFYAENGEILNQVNITYRYTYTYV